ncbi:MAG: flippase-like domain-containing protein [Fibrobacter sp.]|nr:flippase-like domain-containing protein [Fibrobacter sp.]
MKPEKKVLFKKILWNTGRYGFSILLLLILLRGSRINMLTDAFRSVGPLQIIVSILLFFAAQLVSSLKWRIFARGVSLSGLFKWTIVANFYSMLLVGQLSGDVVRIFKMRKLGNQTGSWIALTFYDRFSGLISLLFISFLCLAFSPMKEHIPHYFYNVSLISLISACVLAIGIVFIVKNIRRIREIPSLQSDRFKKVLSWLSGFSADEFRGWGKWISFFTLAFLYQLIGAVIVLILASGILPDVSFIDWCWIIGLTSILLLIPLSAGGLGIREAGFVGILYILGIAREPAIAISLLIYSIQMTGAIAGAILNSLPVASRIVRR